jgi:hypothetical protein
VEFFPNHSRNHKHNFMLYRQVSLYVSDLWHIEGRKPVMNFAPRRDVGGKQLNKEKKI